MRQRRVASRRADNIISTAKTVCHGSRAPVTCLKRRHRHIKYEYDLEASVGRRLGRSATAHVQHSLTGRRRRVEGNCIPAGASSRRGPTRSTNITAPVNYVIPPGTARRKNRRRRHLRVLRRRRNMEIMLIYGAAIASGRHEAVMEE